DEAAMPVGAAHGIGRAQAPRVIGDAEAVTRRARERERALVEGEGALGDLDRVDELGRDEAEVEVAVAVDVRPLVDGHALDRHLEIGAVNRVEAADEELVTLALAAVLDERDAGDEPECVL